MKNKLFLRIMAALLSLLMAVPAFSSESFAAEKETETTIQQVDLPGNPYADSNDLGDAYYSGMVKSIAIADVISPEDSSDEKYVSSDYISDLETMSENSGTALNTIKNRDWYSYSSKYFYKKMNKSQQKLYKDLYKYCLYFLTTADTNKKVETNVKDSRVVTRNGQLERIYVSKAFSFETYGMSFQEVTQLYDMFLFENPQFYFMNYLVYYNYNSFYITYYEKFTNSKTRASYTNKIFDKVDKYVSNVKNIKSTKGPLHAVYVAERLIMDNNRYGWSKQSTDAYGLSKPVFAEEYDQSLYSATMLGYSVCAGYSKAVQAVLSASGLNAITVTSRNATTNMGHAWNLVYINGYWYNLDATWDDNYMDKYGTYQPIYLLISDSKLHSLDNQDLHYPLSYWPGAPICYKNYEDSEAGVPKVTADFKSLKKKFSESYYPAGMKVKPTVKLSTKVFGYDGKKKTPKVTVKVKGKKLSSKYYKVKMPSGRKNIGVYKITVTLRNGYSGKKTVYFKIIPKKLKVKILKAGKKAIYLKWSKASKVCEGYQVEYSTNKKFKNSKKTVKVSKKKTSVTIKKLKSKKVYYVRVRAYKKVKGKMYCSLWSKTKKIKVK